MTTTMPQANDHKRPSLAEQINRLDKTLDGLADGLNDAVADAVQTAVGAAVRAAVQEVLTEVLSNPQVLARLHELLVPLAGKAEAAPKPSAWQRLRTLCQHARACLVGLFVAGGLQVRQVKSATAYLWQGCISYLTKLAMPWRVIRHFQNEILMALAIGVTVGMGAWFAGPWLAAVSSGIGGFATTLSVQAGLFLRKMLAGDPQQVA